MIHDANLRVAATRNFATAPPTMSIGPGVNYLPLPTGYGGGGLNGNPVVFDCQAVMDRGAGRPLLAQFDVLGAFNSTDASITVAFAVSTSTTEDFFSDLVNNTLLVASHAYTLAQLIAGMSVTLIVPPMPSPALYSTGGTVPVTGRRFLGLGLLVNTSIAYNSAALSAGILDAQLVLDVDANERRAHLATSGYTA